MALLTKGAVRSAIAQAIDDPLNSRWSAANLDILTGMVMDTMFQAVLDSAEYFTSALQAVTPAGDGSFALSGLTNRFYRLQQLLRASDGKELHAKTPLDSLPQPAYDLRGTTLFTTPAVTGVNSLNVRYAYLPSKFDSLANDGTSLPSEYPEGHEMALVYVTAAAAMTKGDAESNTQIARLADTAVDALVTHLANRYPAGKNFNVAAVKSAILKPQFAPPMYNPYMQSQG